MPIRSFVVPTCTGNPSLSAEERACVLELLEDSQRDFFEALDGLSETQWRWKPAPEQWSVGETAEHIVLAESLLFASVRRAVASPPNPEWAEQTKGKTEVVTRVVPSRTGKAAAPDRIVPRAGLTPAQVKEGFAAQRTDMVRFARDTQVALKEHTLAHPFPIFGMLHAYHWLLYVPLHTIRHNQQIAEVKAAPGYPAK
jgi:hypothetical protein